MTEEQETTATKIREAAVALKKAKTKEEVQNVWDAYLVIGHRALGKLLRGADPEKLIAKKFGGDE